MTRTRRKLRPVAVSKGVADVYIEGVIGAKDGTTAASFREQLNAAQGAKELRVHINSEGGSVRQGMVIYNALRAFPGTKTAIVEGLAASMASIILQACDERVMTKGAFVMIHNVSSEADGDAGDLRKVADIVEKMQDDAVDIYESRTGKARSEIEALMKEETWMSADEAVAAGFADVVETEAVAVVTFDAVARLNPNKIPEALRALAQKETPMKMTEEEAKALQDKCKALEEENAKLKAEAEEGDDDGEEEEAKSEDDDSDEKHDTHAEDDDSDDAKAILRDVKRITGAKTLGEARGSLMAIAHKAGASARDTRAAAVAQLIKDGKLPPAEKQWALKASESTFKAYVKGVGGAKVAPIAQKHDEPVRGADPAKDGEPTKAESKVATVLGFSNKIALDARGAKFRVGMLKDEN